MKMDENEKTSQNDQNIEQCIRTENNDTKSKNRSLQQRYAELINQDAREENNYDQFSPKCKNEIKNCSFLSKHYTKGRWSCHDFADPDSKVEEMVVKEISEVHQVDTKPEKGEINLPIQKVEVNLILKSKCCSQLIKDNCQLSTSSVCSSQESLPQEPPNQDNYGTVSSSYEANGTHVVRIGDNVNFLGDVDNRSDKYCNATSFIPSKKGQSCLENGAEGSSTGSEDLKIDNEFEQSFDALKEVLSDIVRNEVNCLKHKIVGYRTEISRLERENQILREGAKSNATTVDEPTSDQ